MTFIYGLVEPGGSVRYVGKTDDPELRLRQHIWEAKRAWSDDSYKNRWIRRVLRSGVPPMVRVLEEVPDEIWEACERLWIAEVRALQGKALTNGTAGGEGNRATLETRKRMSACSGQSLLTEEQVIAIRYRRAAGEDVRSLATEFGVAPSTVYGVLTGRTRAFLGGPIRCYRPRRRLTEAEVTEVAERLLRGDTQTAIALDMGVTQAAISYRARRLHKSNSSPPGSRTTG